MYLCIVLDYFINVIMQRFVIQNLKDKAHNTFQ
jgi:hypothetical protein